MKVIGYHKSGNGAVIIKTIISNDDTPHKCSLASLLLLNDYYLALDDDILNENAEIQIYLDKRHEFLTQILEGVGLLRCHYCGKPHLEIGERLLSGAKKNNANPNLATIDHVIPVSSGIDKLDETNWVVACKRCNKRKGTMDYDKFLKLLPEMIKNYKKTGNPNVKTRRKTKQKHKRPGKVQREKKKQKLLKLNAA